MIFAAAFGCKPDIDTRARSGTIRPWDSTLAKWRTSAVARPRSRPRRSVRSIRTGPFEKSEGALFGLTPAKHQSGEIDRTGAIIAVRRRDDADDALRSGSEHAALDEVSWLKAWAIKIARRRGMKKAIVALARRLAVIIHRIWVDGAEFRWTREGAAA
jgi:hypothetical protein